MKAVQIDRYSKEIRTVLREIPVPEIGPTEVLVEVRAAAVNPLELLILSGSVRLIFNVCRSASTDNFRKIIPAAHTATPSAHLRAPG